MAEEFIKDIYDKAEIIYGMKLCCEHLTKRSLDNYGLLWNMNSDRMIESINDFAKYDEEAANSLETLVSVVVQSNYDIAYVNELICGGILPLLYKYMSYYGGIDVTEGNYQLKSTRSGYLTLYDKKNNFHLHSLDDPMWEAFTMAKAIYNGKYTVVKILGAGLGYFACALWGISGGSMEIYIYENDPIMAEYAKLYGVMYKIPDNKLHYIVIEDAEELYLKMQKDTFEGETVLTYVSEWIKYAFTGDTKKYVEMMSISTWAYVGFENDYKTNYWKNLMQFQGDFTELTNKMTNDEYIVVAAGPSFDKCIEYLRINKGKKNIIAVNTILRRMLDNGIEPDLVCLLDPTDGVYCHVEGIEDRTVNIPLISERVAYWRFVSVYRGPKYCAYASIFPEAMDEATKNGIECISSGSSVTSFAIEIAVNLGAKRIELVGADLSFPGDIYHAGDKEKYLNRDIKSEIFVKAVDGKTVKSVDTFEIFKRDIETKIYRYPYIEFVNLSDNGALISGTLSGGWKGFSLSEYRDKISILKQGDLVCLLRIGGILPDVEYSYWGYTGYVAGLAFSSEMSEKEVDLLSEILTRWSNEAEETNNVSAVIYLATVLISINHNICVINNEMNKLKKYVTKYLNMHFLVSQIYEKVQMGEVPYIQSVNNYLELSSNGVADNLCFLLGKDKMQPIVGTRNENLCFIFIDSISEGMEKNTGSVNIALQMINNGKQVVMINTSEKFPMVGRIPIYKEKARDNCKKYISMNELAVNGVNIPYFQCEETMPNKTNISLIIDYIRKYRPATIISYSKYSPIVRIIGKLCEVEYKD